MKSIGREWLRKANRERGLWTAGERTSPGGRVVGDLQDADGRDLRH